MDSMMSDSDLLEPSIDPKKKVIGYRNVVCENPAGGARTVVSVRDTPGFVIDEPTERGGTNKGPTPVESVMGGLCGCDAAITHQVAHIMKFKYGDVSYSCDAEIDVRGARGVKGVRPYFEKVTVKKIFRSNESAERIEKLKANVEQRCPVSNLIRDAGVDLHIEWVIEPM
tara:strand:- start:763 stop:1272 length:510 start_codon:yes stop_codon:yes gene_type:complete